MAIKLADTARPNNHVDSEHLGTFPVAYAEDVWFEDGTRLSEKTFDGQSIQVTELPPASAVEEGHVYQYLGTTGTYTHGCFYECVEQSGNYDWKILQTVENCVFYTDRNLVDSTAYPVGTTMVYTGEPQWGFFKGHHYMYVENQTLTLYKFNCTYNGAIVSVVFTDKELKVGTTRLRDFDGYIVDYVSEVNGDTATVTNRGGSTETLTDLVFTGETEDITFTGWVDIGGGGSDGGTDYEEFIGTQAEWDALSQAEKNKYDGKIVNITDDAEGENLDYYSTSEVKTNKVWIDGKPIYRKVIDCGALPNNNTKNIPHNIGALSNVISLNGMATFDNGNHKQYLPAPYVANTLTANDWIYFSADKNSIVIKTWYDFTGYNFVAIIEYTKPTD